MSEPITRTGLVLQVSSVDGYYACREGKLLMSNPWPSGSPGATAWAEGWHEANHEMTAQRQASASSVWFLAAKP